MSAEGRLPVVLYWHMHQPEYRDLRSGACQLPWTYLHAIKDYTDMAAHLERHPQARAIVNFSPTLLEQIDDYRRQVHSYLNEGGAILDPMLAALADPALPTAPQDRLVLINQCLRAHEENLIGRFAPYQGLADIAAWLNRNPGAAQYINNQYLVDLLVWHHLAWMGETVRRQDARIQGLLKKKGGYTLHDRRELMVVIGELLNGLIDRYRALADAGQIELSVTPYAHPITPLLIDLQCARDAMPDVHLPNVPAYPGGTERAAWHMRRGLEVFEHFFGRRPQGCWPSEGGLSEATLRLMAEHGIRWSASGGQVLKHSLQRAGANLEEAAALHQAYRFADSAVDCFFRDDGLSDLVGFTYSEWHADDAVNNLLHHLENIAVASAGVPQTLVSIILDGENAWEYYPENGYYFLDALYGRLADHPRFELTTYTRWLERSQAAPRHLPKLVAGSWVYGNFSTWIGDDDKNRGWDMLGDAKRCFDETLAAGTLDAAQQVQAEQQLAVCEGSDWCWWFGDYNPSASVHDFERLYRLHLANLYQILGREPPAYLAQSFTHGGGAPAAGGTMRPGQEPGH